MAFRDDDSTRPPRFLARCQLNELEAYAVDAHRPEKADPSMGIRVHYTADAGRTWTPVPMKLSLFSYLRMWVRGAGDEWPPPRLDELRWEGSVLRLRFRDDVWSQGVPYEYMWDAYYHPARQIWTIHKVRKIYIDA